MTINFMLRGTRELFIGGVALPDCNEYTTTERVALIVWWLCAKGKTMTTEEIAGRLDISYDGTRRMLNRISRVIPLHQVEGQWHGFIFEMGADLPRD